MQWVSYSGCPTFPLTSAFKNLTVLLPMNLIRGFPAMVISPLSPVGPIIPVAQLFCIELPFLWYLLQLCPW